ncbi:hypothetical protein WA026_006883 [Henosepilachna vigintioctopunctata]|uniref:Uncharacterized protein n=1 Tax=Henosepilachna vigintioctopunctata TaxID=420089 RepID=A0AAW1VCB4_9CUCU
MARELNTLNVSLQSKNKLFDDMHADIEVLQMKNKLFLKHINEKKLDHFPNCKKAAEEAGINFHWKNDIKDMFIQLQSQFSHIFNDSEEASSLFKFQVANPFSCDIEDVRVMMLSKAFSKKSKILLFFVATCHLILTT